MKHYLGIQSLRALGALLVVIFHATNAVRDRIDASAWQFDTGMAGVDLFFIISGFIMIVATEPLWSTGGGGHRAAWQFLSRRIIRVVPLYWLATSLKLIMVLILPAAALNAIGVWHTISSYLFIPAWNAKGENFPLLVPGWTLSFEMFFYLWFALVLFLRKHPVYWLTPLFAVFVLYHSVFKPFDAAPMTLLNQHLLEFCLGMWIGLAACRARLLPAAIARPLAVMSIIVLLSIHSLAGDAIDHLPLLMWGVPSALLIYAVISLEDASAFWRRPLFQTLGDASYAMYLFHPFIVFVLAKILLKFNPSTEAALIAIIPLSLLLSSIAGVVIHRIIERPMTNYLRLRMAR
jgi:peptidoglycan/LPS O-acetylase OafA/YrhL